MRLLPQCIRSMEQTNQEVFLSLLKAGLWEQEFQFSSNVDMDFGVVFQLAKEQSVTGLVAADIDYLEELKMSQKDTLQVVGVALLIEQRNRSMNDFINKLIEKLRKNQVYPLLVKGQGVAQCYARPLWRTSGDIDLLLSDNEYDRAKEILAKMAISVEPEDTYKKHVSMQIEDYVVELHGNLHTCISGKIDRHLDKIQSAMYAGSVRVWSNGSMDIFLPDPNCDVLFVFCHILQHFFKGGIGLRQVCDWCRLSWTYRDKIDIRLLKRRLRKMGILSEWKVFATLAVDVLGLPADAMPLYSKSTLNHKRARMALGWILKSGNMGHNIDQSYRKEYSHHVQKMITLGRRIKEYCYFFVIFPIDAPRFFFSYVSHKILKIL